jgi:hypothetical protein
MAVAHADYILELQSNLDRAEMPPVWMWPHSKEMNAWIDKVQRDRKNKISNPAAEEDESLQENDLLAEMRKRRGA